MWSHKLFDYYGGLMPDIFASYCTESTFSFLCAALQLQWIVCKKTAVDHDPVVDGASSGFKPSYPAWNHMFRSPKEMKYIIQDPEGTNLGFGYEELQQIKMHRGDQFDENHFCKNDKLKEWLKKNIFLDKKSFDYNKIQHIWEPNE